MRLHTGRRHQLRLHCLHLGHPIVGDQLYAPQIGAPRTMLHAFSMKVLDHTTRKPVYNFKAQNVLKDYLEGYKEVGVVEDIVN